MLGVQPQEQLVFRGCWAQFLDLGISNMNKLQHSHLNNTLKVRVLCLYLGFQAGCRTGLSCPSACPGSAPHVCGTKGDQFRCWSIYAASFCFSLLHPFPRPFHGLFKPFPGVFSAYQAVYHHSALTFLLSVPEEKFSDKPFRLCKVSDKTGDLLPFLSQEFSRCEGEFCGRIWGRSR